MAAATVSLEYCLPPRGEAEGSVVEGSKVPVVLRRASIGGFVGEVCGGESETRASHRAVKETRDALVGDALVGDTFVGDADALVGDAVSVFDLRRSGDLPSIANDVNTGGLGVGGSSSSSSFFPNSSESHNDPEGFTAVVLPTESVLNLADVGVCTSPR